MLTRRTLTQNNEKQHGQTMDVIKNKEKVNRQGEHVELSNRQTKELQHATP